VNSNSHYNKQVEGVLERVCIQQKQQWNSLVERRHCSVRGGFWRKRIQRRNHRHGRRPRWEVFESQSERFLGGRYERRCWGFERWWCFWEVDSRCLPWTVDGAVAVDCDVGRNFRDDVFCCICGDGCHWFRDAKNRGVFGFLYSSKSNDYVITSPTQSSYPKQSR